jgi:putative oxidoreductase
VITLPRERLLRAADAGTRASLPLLRYSLGIVFIWFGALKLTQSTPIADLVAATVPFLPESWFVPALGAFEVMIGIALLIGRWIGVVVALMVAHLAGTFLVIVMQPDAVFQHDNPLLLTMTGEFVVKNLVLIAAGLVLAGAARQARPS